MKNTLTILLTFVSISLFSQNLMRSETAFLMNGNSFLTSNAVTPIIPVDPPVSTQIIADHNAVAAFDNIPQYWIDEVKKMQLGYVGESHSEGVRIGVQLVEDSDAKYSVDVTARPAVASSANLRVFAQFPNNGTSWGNLGEYEWYKNGNAISSIRAGITRINATDNTPMDVFGFGWCWDPNETADDMPDYVNATKNYIGFCADNSYQTKVIFTTGPVDDQNAYGETGWNKYLAYEVIRDSVANDPTRILFDFADILCYDDNSQTPTTTTYGANIYPIITPTNVGNSSYAHMGEAGCLRLGKAMWWMLARIAGWDGEIE